ncbi:hypothetical protein OG21DRAFT_356749 [Imleria badia]|nr:hypothetical protein OG21DRAFT_356749 [Imleria badia]
MDCSRRGRSSGTLLEIVHALSTWREKRAFTCEGPLFHLYYFQTRKTGEGTKVGSTSSTLRRGTGRIHHAHDRPGTFQTRRNGTKVSHGTYNVTFKILSNNAVDMLRNHMPVNHTLDMVRRQNA